MNQNKTKTTIELETGNVSDPHSPKTQIALVTGPGGSWRRPTEAPRQALVKNDKKKGAVCGIPRETRASSLDLISRHKLISSPPGSPYTPTLFFPWRVERRRMPMAGERCARCQH
jgi:hypothetical protein